MKILVFSDSHGRGERMRRVIGKSDADTVIFLGDGLREFDLLKSEFTSILFISVKGNCDSFDGTPEERLVTLDGIKILLLHGHTRGVKRGTGVLEGYGQSIGADLILYGHTHNADNRYISESEKPYYIFNPGSIGEESFAGSTFGYIETVSGELVLNHAFYKE